MMESLRDSSTRAPESFEKDETKKKTAALLESLTELQYLLYAEGRHAVLVVLQGMDASGKDGVIRKVFGCMNPQGVHVQPFKAPTEEELSHDFLWRIHRHAPAKGMIQVFNRSHYEDVLVTRVNGWCDDATAALRFEAINHFEALLQQHNQTVILKFYLHVSQEEQAERLQERTEDPAKHWKYDVADRDKSQLREQYLQAYQDVFTHCNQVPWTIVPADQNWYKEYLVAKSLVQALEDLNMKFPALKKDS